MKRFVGVLIVLSLAATVHAGLDIGFSTNDEGYWSYTASDKGIGTFSFTVAGVNILSEDGGPVNSGDSVTISNLEVSLDSLTPDTIHGIDIYTGIVTPVDPATIVISRGKKGNHVLTGDLGIGTIVIVGTTASLYPTSMDFSLTLQGSTDIESMISNGITTVNGGTFSGNMTIPEPATIFFLAIGSVLFWKKQ